MKLFKNRKDKKRKKEIESDFEKYCNGKFYFTIKVLPDTLAQLLNPSAPRSITLLGDKYNFILHSKGVDEKTNEWYGIYRMYNYTQALTFENFERLYKCIVVIGK